MPTIEEFIQGKSPLTPSQIYRLRELVADWQLLSDLPSVDTHADFMRSEINKNLAAGAIKQWH